MILSNKKNFKYIIYIFLITLFLSLFTEIIANKYMNNHVNNKFKGNVSNLSDQDFTYINQIKDNNSFTILNNDPNITYTFEQPKTIGNVMIYFSEPLKENMNIQIFYATEGEFFSGDNTKFVTVKAGTKQVNFSIPIKEYSYLRLDIGEVEGQIYTLDKILVSNINEKETSFNFDFNFNRFIVVFIFYLLILVMVFEILKKYKFSYLEKINILINSNSYIIDLFFIVFLTLVFFSIMPILSFDTFWYHTYLDIFEGGKSITSWDPTRGLPFPLLIYISTKLFGYTTQGITITMYIFYLISIFFTFKLCKITGIRNIIKKVYLWIILLFLLFINPIYLGYYHLVLTEFVVSTLLIVYIYILLYTHQKIHSNNSTISIYIMRLLTLIVFSNLSFFIKQMYFLIIIIPFVASEFILIINKLSIKRIIFTFINILLSIIVLITININWNQYIDIKNARNIFGAEFTNSSAFSSSISNGLRYFVPEKNNDDEMIQVAIMDDNEVKRYFSTYNPKHGISNALRYTLDCFVESPKTAVKSYADNYYVIANLYRFKDTTDDYYRQEIEKKFSFIYGRENNYLACTPNQILDRNSMVYTGIFDEYMHVTDGDQYKQKFDNNFFAENIYKDKYIKLANFLYSFIAFLALPILIYSTFMLLKYKKYWGWHLFNFIYSFTIFFHILQLALLGSSIDRYAFPLYTFCVLIIINYLIMFKQLLIKMSLNIRSGKK